METLMRSKNKKVILQKNRRKPVKNGIKSKLSPRVNEVTALYLKNDCNIGQTARMLGVKWETLKNFLQSSIARESLHKVDVMNADLAIKERTIKQEIRIKTLNECWKCLSNTRDNNKKLKWFNQIANIIGLGKEIDVAKIQAGNNQGGIESNGGQLSTEEVDHIKSVTKDDKE